MASILSRQHKKPLTPFGVGGFSCYSPRAKPRKAAGFAKVLRAIGQNLFISLAQNTRFSSPVSAVFFGKELSKAC